MCKPCHAPSSNLLNLRLILVSHSEHHTCLKRNDARVQFIMEKALEIKFLHRNINPMHEIYIYTLACLVTRIHHEICMKYANTEPTST